MIAEGSELIVSWLTIAKNVAHGILTKHMLGMVNSKHMCMSRMYTYCLCNT